MIEIYKEIRRREKGQHWEEGGGGSNPRPFDHEERAPQLCYNHCHKFKTDQSCYLMRMDDVIKTIKL